ncbi:MAG: hypothetical protein Q8R37_04710 [Nanoarchaeota archaeon]|nr:hypothetical protein [Nanoarchaeota archaeon]
MERENDERQLVTFDRRLGQYDVAVALCSYCDVLDFVVDEKKQGIVLIDTCGHSKEFGQQMAAFF